jgi:hypothetical protein
VQRTEADKSNRVVGVAVVQSLLLETLETGIGQVSSVKVGGKIEEDGEGKNTEI